MKKGKFRSALQVSPTGREVRRTRVRTMIPFPTANHPTLLQIPEAWWIQGAGRLYCPAMHTGWSWV